MKGATSRTRFLVLLAGLLVDGLRTPLCAESASDAIAEIRQIAKEDSLNYERLLARASPIMQKAFQDKAWSDVKRALIAAGLKLVATDEDPYNVEYRCVVMPNAVATKGGPGMDLYLQLDVSSGRSQPTYEVPPNYTISQAIVGLEVAPGVGQEQARREKWFGEGTVIQDALASWPVMDAQTAFPVLETVDLSFGPIRDIAAEHEGDEYRLRLEFVHAKDERQHKLRLECSAVAPDAEGHRRGPVDNWLRRETSPPGTGVKLGDDLRALLGQKGPSYQRILRDANRIVRRAIAGREWAAVAPELKGQDLKLVADSAGDFGTHQRYVVAKRTFTTEAGESMDMILDVNTSRRTSNTAATREIVTDAFALFRAEPKLPYAQVVAEGRFGKGTAIDKALRNDEVKKAAERNAVLDSVEVYYCLAGDHRWPTSHYSFEVRPEFQRGKDDRSGWASLYFLVPSGLDPPEQAGGMVLQKDFVSRDTIGDAYYHGAAESSPDQRRTDFFLTKKGEPRWRKTADDKTEPTLAYSVGDLKALSPKTAAIGVQNRELYDDDLATLARFTDLKFLDVGECVGITDTALAHLAGLKQLRTLKLPGNRITGAGFIHLRGLTALQALELNSAEGLTDQGIVRLADMKSLTKLNLGWPRELTDDQLARIAQLSELRELRIWGSGKISDAGLKHISTLGKLESLTFSHANNVTARGVAQLASLKNLKEISLGYMALNDDSLHALSRMASLEYVDLHGLKVSDAGIQALGNLPLAKRFYFDDCGRITCAGVKNLSARLKGDFVLED